MGADVTEAKPGSRVRRAYVCYVKGNDGEIHKREFVGPTDPVPKCKDHGTMRPQPNNKYMGQPV